MEEKTFSELYEEKNGTTIGMTLFLMLVCIVATAPAMIWGGYVLQVLWGWFLTPLFGMAVPSIAYCLGLSLILSYATNQDLSGIPTKDRKYPELVASAMSRSFIRPAWILLIGWVLSHYV
jgi:phosphate/sulfate permease